jgi:hypothetical protein
MKSPYPRISRVHNSWKVRVYGLPPRYFSPTEYGSSQDALRAAEAWRDEHWDGSDRRRKLTAEQEREIRTSGEHYKVLAERYGISPTYVHEIRRRR